MNHTKADKLTSNRVAIYCNEDGLSKYKREYFGNKTRPEFKKFCTQKSIYSWRQFRLFLLKKIYAGLERLSGKTQRALLKRII